MSAATRSPPARMRTLRTLSLVLAFTAAVGLIFGTAGFTALEADRGVAVNVTDDERAFLGYEPLTDDVRHGEPTAVVEYRNQFGSDLDELNVSVSIADDGSTRAAIDSVETPSSIGEGTAAGVTVTLRCPERESVPLLFEADGNGGGVSVSLDRVHTVTCVPEAPEVAGVTFDGAANGNVSVSGSDGDVVATVWLAENPPTESVETLTAMSFDGAASFDTSKKLKPQVVRHPSADELAQDQKIVAVEFLSQSVTYVHPGWDAGVYENPSSNNGVEYHGAVDEQFLLNVSVEGDEVTAESEADD